MICKIRKWVLTDAADLAAALSNRKVQDNLRDGLPYPYTEQDGVVKLTDQPVTAVATHIHWDHIGGHKYFPDFYAHEEELGWLSGGFPLSVETVRDMVVERCELPEGYDVGSYEMFQGRPSVILHGGERIDIGGRIIEVFHTPGHSPGHMCFREPGRGYLFTGDLIYKDTLFAYYPSTDPRAYLSSLEKSEKYRRWDMKPDEILKYCLENLEGSALVESWGEKGIFYNPGHVLKRGGTY